MEKSKEYLDREELLLCMGRQLLVKQGFVGLQMESIALQTNLSRATVYKHFGSKEELASKIVLDATRMRFIALEKASGFNGTTRERMLALLIAEGQFAALHPDQYPSELIIGVSGLLAPSRPEIQATLNDLDLRIRSLYRLPIEQAVRHGDLPNSCNSEELLNGIVAMGIGIQVWNLLGSTRFASERYSLSPAFIQRMLDGFEWHPLTDHLSHEECTHRILKYLKN